MKFIIHRGSREIGGTCIQLSTDKTTVLLDLGLPLSKESRDPDLKAIKPDAVLISHPHQDHYGLIDRVGKNVPVYIGEVGRNLIDATRVFLKKGLHTNNFRYFESWKPFNINDLKITPYLVDHSASDAYAFLIEAYGKRVFYSGDFRAHGRKRVLFDKMIEKPPKNIDVLFMEGTMMQRSNDEFSTEEAVEEKIYDTIARQENITFLISSSQNIDRIVSAYRACKRAQKTFVIDLYTAWVLEQMRTVTGNVPGIGWVGIRVYADHSQNEALQRNPEYFGNFKRDVYKYRIEKEELKASPAKYLYCARMAKFNTIDLYKGEKAVNVIYSQWLGYLKCLNAEYYGAEQISAYQRDKQVNFVYAHTSGHATVEDLRSFAQAMNSKQLVPIHTEHGDQFNKLFNNVIEIKDHQMFVI